MPGWHQGSWGFHSDDCKFFSGDMGLMQSGREYGSTFGANDVVGCGVDYGSDQLFFTLNGHYLGRHTFKNETPVLEKNTDNI